MGRAHSVSPHIGQPRRAFDFFHRYPQPRTIAPDLSKCDVKCGGLLDDPPTPSLRWPSRRDPPMPRLPSFAEAGGGQATPVRGRLHFAEARWGRERGRGSRGRAGIYPRHKHGRPCFPTACAGFVAQSPPCGVDLRAMCRGPLVTPHSPLTTSFLIANGILESPLTFSKQTTAILPNREKFRVSNTCKPASGMTLRREVKKTPARRISGGTLAAGAANRNSSRGVAGCASEPAQEVVANV
jgi:hypothetical protein